MDWWSGIFIAFCSTGLIYGGLGLIHIYRKFFDKSGADILSNTNLRVLGMATVISILIPATLLVLHLTGVITMWEIGYVLTYL